MTRDDMQIATVIKLSEDIITLQMKNALLWDLIIRFARLVGRNFFMYSLERMSEKNLSTSQMEYILEIQKKLDLECGWHNK